MTKELNDFFTCIFKSLGFTRKQIETAIWVLHGFSNEQISVLMRSKVVLIKQLLTAIYKKAKVKNRAQFIVFCYKYAIEKQLQLVNHNLLTKGL